MRLQSPTFFDYLQHILLIFLNLQGHRCFLVDIHYRVNVAEIISDRFCTVLGKISHTDGARQDATVKLHSTLILTVQGVKGKLFSLLHIQAELE